MTNETTQTAGERLIGVVEMQQERAKILRAYSAPFDTARQNHKYYKEVLVSPKYSYPAKQYAALKIASKKATLFPEPTHETWEQRAKLYLIAGQKDTAAKEYLLAAAVGNGYSYLKYTAGRKPEVVWADRRVRDDYLQKALGLYNELGDSSKIRLIKVALQTGNQTNVDSKWEHYKREFEKLFINKNGKLENRLVESWLRGEPFQYETIMASNWVEGGRRKRW